jgi:hypothetical protein
VEVGDGTVVLVGTDVSLGTGLTESVGGSVGEAISVLTVVGGITGNSVGTAVGLVVLQAAMTNIKAINGIMRLLIDDMIFSF